jgi:hypothetical protein
MATHTLRPTRDSTLRRFWHENGLSLTLGALFIVFLIGQALTGHRHHNEEQIQHGQDPVTLTEYLSSGAFIEATAENWESEFLQMAVYVLFTVFLYQRGSSESKKIGEAEAVDRDPRRSKHKADAPWPVRRGGWVLTLYSNSLALAFLLLFLISFIAHAIGGTRARNEEELAHGGPAISVLEYLQSSQFWFESFQNWQSEFLAIGLMVVLSIFLRQRGSPESKPVDAPHDETGSD